MIWRKKMNVTIYPKKLSGKVTVPPSKSVAHRMIIAAALAKGRSEISNLSSSVDILATIECMRALGTEIDLHDNTAVIKGIDNVPEKAVLNCCESGSTLRFLIPVACALGVQTTFIGRANLPKRPITPLTDELPEHGINFDFSKAEKGDSLPCTVSGKLTSGKYSMSGSVSSQFITGLLFALSLLEGDSEIVLTSHLQSKPYVDITIGTLKEFGVEIAETKDGYFVKGSQKLKPFNGTVEGDYSQAAFFEVANSLGSDIDIEGLNVNSFQGDKEIIEICRKMVYNNEKGMKPFDIDCSDIPDLVPILTVLATFCDGKSYIRNVARLRIKECDRLAAMTENINKLGGKVKAFDDSLEIEGVRSLTGGEVQSFVDHRIAMSMAVVATKCESPLKILGAECVSKSYPDFFDVYRSLGGEVSAED